MDIRLDQRDTLFFVFRDNAEHEIKLMNKLQFNQFTILYGLPQKQSSSLDSLVKRTIISKLRDCFQRFFYENLIGKKEIVVLNEESMDADVYREFNRRTHKKSG